MPYLGKSPQNGVRQRYVYVATSGQTSFSGNDESGISLTYPDGAYIDVYQNGVLLKPGTDYTSTTGTTVVLATGASTNDVVEMIVYDIFSVGDAVSAASGGTFGGNVAMAGTLNVTGAFTSPGIDDNADATAITIDSSERVGIGTTSPVALLTMVAADGVMADQYVAKFTNSEATAGQNYGVFVAGGSTSADESFSVRKFDSSATYFKVRGDGSTFFNCTSAPSASVVGSAFIKNDHDSQLQLSGSLTTGNNIVEFYNPNGRVGSITTNGSATAYNTSSDYRLKENVTYDWDATTRLKQLKPARFNFIADPDTTVDGFLAHEAQTVCPESVSGSKDEVDADGNPIMQGIDQSKIVPLLVKTILELEARITALEA